MLPSVDNTIQHDVLLFIEELMIDSDKTLDKEAVVKAIQSGLEVKVLILLSKCETVLRRNAHDTEQSLQPETVMPDKMLNKI